MLGGESCFPSGCWGAVGSQSHKSTKEHPWRSPKSSPLLEAASLEQLCVWLGFEYLREPTLRDLSAVQGG